MEEKKEQELKQVFKIYFLIDKDKKRNFTLKDSTIFKGDKNINFLKTMELSAVPTKIEYKGEKELTREYYLKFSKLIEEDLKRLNKIFKKGITPKNFNLINNYERTLGIKQAIDSELNKGEANG